MTNTDKLTKLMEQLRHSLKDRMNIMPDEETAIRFLKARNWDINAAETMILKDLQWRSEYKPSNLDCSYCHKCPGTHSLRQVGFDEAGRPVIYSSFCEAIIQRNTTSDVITHLVYTIENAIRTMRPGITQWVFVIDCAGMTTAACHPRLGYECARIMANHYPERLGLAICIKPGPAFKVAWQAIKPFLPSTTVAKVCLIRQKSQIQPTFERYFSPDLCDWLMAEVNLNRVKTKIFTSRRFWLPPSDKSDKHDPRGDLDYLQNWVFTAHPNGHLPHPNILDALQNQLVQVNSSESLQAILEQQNFNSFKTDDDVEDENEDEIAKNIIENLPSEFLIPADAEKLP